MPWDKIRKTSSHPRSANFSRRSQARPWGGVAGGELGRRWRGGGMCGNQKKLSQEMPCQTVTMGKPTRLPD